MAKTHSDILIAPGHRIALINCELDTEGTLSAGLAFFDCKLPPQVEAGDYLIEIPRELQNKWTPTLTINIRLNYSHAQSV